MKSSSSATLRTLGAASTFFSRAFPTPELLIPSAAGIDISDASIKWLVLETSGGHTRVKTFGEVPLKEGVVLSGIVHDVDALAETLVQVKSQLHGVRTAHAALPEEAVYVFSMAVPSHTPRNQVLKMIEFELEGRVPIPPNAAVYDYTLIPGAEHGEDQISVVVFPQEVAEAYVDAFSKAGISLLSLEVEANSIARAVTSGGESEPISLLVDFGRSRTGFAVIKAGVPIFTSTVEVGGDLLMHTLTEKLSVKPEDVEKFKNEEGLSAQGEEKKALVEAVTGTASALADEITRHYRYWDTRRNEHGERMTPVAQVVLVGGNANLRGLVDYVAGRVQAHTRLGNVWRNVASFDEYIPPIARNESLQYATAIGLALRSRTP